MGKSHFLRNKIHRIISRHQFNSVVPKTAAMKKKIACNNKNQHISQQYDINIQYDIYIEYSLYIHIFISIYQYLNSKPKKKTKKYIYRFIFTIGVWEGVSCGHIYWCLIVLVIVVVPIRISWQNHSWFSNDQQW